ncbi:MAG TPA: cardiolipin synthase [Noviherbaspirillum sp.]
MRHHSLVRLLPRFARAALGLTLLLTACASLPDVTNLGRREHAAPPQALEVVTSHGAMPAARKEALIDRLAAKAGPTDILNKHIAAEQAINGTPLVAGNKVTLLDDGPVTMRAMMNAIRNAHDHINLETYIFEDDEVGDALAKLLIEKHRAGLQVNVIYDSAGTLGTPAEFFEHMRDAGIHTLEFNPVNPLHTGGQGWDLNQRDHRKLLVVDGRIAFTGGVNISRVYGKSAMLASARRQTPKDPKEAAWRDTHMQIEGPAVAEFQKLFLDTWQRKTGHALTGANYFPPLQREGNALVRALGSTPDQPEYPIFKTYVSAFVNADRSIHLTTAYFVPDKQVMQALIDASKRGVDVRIVFPSISDVGIMLYAARSFYSELLGAGVKVYERKNALLHAKTAVIDGVWSTIGSTNLDIRSFMHNDEINAVVLNTDFAAQMEALFQRDIASSHEVTAEEWRERGLGERMKEWGVRLFQYWL